MIRQPSASTRSLGITTLLLCLSCIAGVGEQRPEEKAVEVSRELQRLESDYAAGKAPERYTFKEEDVNAYLMLARDEYAATGVKEVLVRMLGNNTLSFSLSIDSDRIALNLDSWTQTLVDALLNGEYLLEFEGILRSAAGRGNFDLTSARINGVPVPVSLVEVALQTVGARLSPPFDPKQGFELQYGIDRVTIEPGKAIVHTLARSR